MTEEWRPIPDWEGFYEASSWGRIRGLDRLVQCPGKRPYLRRGRILAQWPDQDGYLITALCKGGLHQDNRPVNLYHGTRSQNIYDQVRHGTHRNSRKRWCGSCGGKYDTVNTRGERVCRSCAARNARAYRARRRAAA